jgi:OOP family OmpA-OmpF porin
VRRATCLLSLVVLGLAACARLTDHVVLLPGPDGRTGALSVTAASGEMVLSEPYTGVDVAGGKVTRLSTSAAMVREAFGPLLDMQPPRPRFFVVHFEVGKDVLTPASRSLLANVGTELASLPAGEAVVIGHTDRMGTREFNDRLSLQRAELVRERLVGAGVPRDAISVAGRGEREPVVVTADEVAEPRNRRVDIKLR